MAIRLDPKDRSLHPLRGLFRACKGDYLAALGEWIFHPQPIKIVFRVGSEASVTTDRSRTSPDSSAALSGQRTGLANSP
jgi:hypothetical protein